jgi:hypothetical protein
MEGTFLKGLKHSPVQAVLADGPTIRKMHMKRLLLKRNIKLETLHITIQIIDEQINAYL